MVFCYANLTQTYGEISVNFILILYCTQKYLDAKDFMKM